jgi:rubrerythrin
MRAFSSLSEQEILALAISLEEEDARHYDDLAEAVKAGHPALAEEFHRLRGEEDGHRHRLLDVYRQRFGDHIPLIRRQDVKGFVHRSPIWFTRPFGAEAARTHAAVMEAETKRFYEAAARRSTDAGIRQLLGDLAEEERKHEHIAEQIQDRSHEESEAEARQRLFVLQIIQPGLAGLMDGSVSTLAPLFAAAFATRNNWDTFLVGLAAALGAGISMGFAEALSDDGALTGRGHPLIRGLACGLMTAVGGLGHALPYLLPQDPHDSDSQFFFNLATGLAVAVVLIELGVIAWIRHRYMDTPLVPAVLQVVVGGVLVFLVGMLIGSS